MPIINAGEPVVVKAVPEIDPEKITPAAVDQLVVLDVFQVPELPTQYLLAMVYSGSVGGSSVGRALTIANQLSNLCCFIDSITSLEVESYSACDIHNASRYV
jgi:hypothetical protein